MVNPAEQGWDQAIMEKGREWIVGVMPEPDNDKSVCRKPGGGRGIWQTLRQSNYTVRMNSIRRIAHLDMDAFFASVELLRYPGVAWAACGGRRA
jgi:hypothetical protein